MCMLYLFRTFPGPHGNPKFKYPMRRNQVKFPERLPLKGMLHRISVSCFALFIFFTKTLGILLKEFKVDKKRRECTRVDSHTN